MIPSGCPGGGVGLAVRVTPGSVGATIGGSVTVTVNDAPSVTIPIEETLNPGSPPATISACLGR